MSTIRKRSLWRRTIALVLVASLFNLVACTEYTPVQNGVDATVGKEVRVRLTDQGTVDVAPRIGLRAQSVEGILQAITDSSLSLSVRKVSREGGIEDTYAGEQLSMARRDFETVETSRTSVARSLLLTGGLVAAALLLARGAVDLSGGKGSGPPPPTK